LQKVGEGEVGPGVTHGAEHSRRLLKSP
jgi:hypothetical protein